MNLLSCTEDNWVQQTTAEYLELQRGWLPIHGAHPIIQRANRESGSESDNTGSSLWMMLASYDDKYVLEPHSIDTPSQLETQLQESESAHHNRLP